MSIAVGILFLFIGSIFLIQAKFAYDDRPPAHILVLTLLMTGCLGAVCALAPPQSHENQVTAGVWFGIVAAVVFEGLVGLVVALLLIEQEQEYPPEPFIFAVCGALFTTIIGLCVVV